MPMPPGDTVARSARKAGNYTVRSVSGSITSGSQNPLVYQEQRPSYAKGLTALLGELKWIFPTSYTHYSRRITQGQTSYRKNWPDGTWSSVGETSPDIATKSVVHCKWGMEFDSFINYNVRSAAEVKALNKLGDAKAQLGESLGTWLQTVRLFTSKTKLLAELLDACKKSKLKRYLRQSAREVKTDGDLIAAGLYLEYVYGWKPLVSDIYGIHQLLKQYASGVKPIIIHGHGSQTQSSSTDFFSLPVQGPVGSKPIMNAFGTETYKGSCDLYARVDPEYIGLKMMNQLGLVNPASIAWELTPWSFVVDWLLPIGPVLQALTAPIGLKFISGTTSTRCSKLLEGDYHCESLRPPTALSIEDLACNFTVVDELYKRDKLSTWPLPTPYLNLNPFAGDRSFKALALFLSSLPRR